MHTFASHIGRRRVKRAYQSLSNHSNKLKINIQLGCRQGLDKKSSHNRVTLIKNKTIKTKYKAVIEWKKEECTIFTASE